MNFLFSTAYLAPIQQYSRLLIANKITEERHETFAKQTYRNRCTILSANGPLSLSIPIAHADGNQAICNVKISTHDNWKKQHWNALVSAYKNSPYFEYLAPELRMMYEHPCVYLTEFNASLQALMCKWLGLDVDIECTEAYVRPDEFLGEDCRNLIFPKRDWRTDTHFHPVSYYQVFAEKFGFIENLSIVDLLFNTGPEARLILAASYR